MKRRFLMSNKPILILFGVSCFLYLLYSLIGIEEVVSMPEYSSFYGNLYEWVLLGDIFVPVLGICIGSFIVFFILKNYVYKENKALKILLCINSFLIFGSALAQFIIIVLESRSEPLTDAGIDVVLLLIAFWIHALLLTLLTFYQAKEPNFVEATSNKTTRSNNAEFHSSAEKLRELNDLYVKGIITEEEYNEKKKKYIDLL